MRESAKIGRGAILYIASRIFFDSVDASSPGAIAVKDGVVVASGHPREVERSLPVGFERKEYPGAVILPGLVNAHTHLQIPRLPVPGGGPPGSLAFVEWILRVIAWKRNAPPEEFRRNFESAAAEALSLGTTAVGEICGPDPDAYSAAPLRARVFAEGIGFDPKVASEVLASVEGVIARLEKTETESEGMAVPGVSPHTLYTVGPSLLKHLGELAGRKRLPACLHLAESPAEMEFLSSGGGDVATRLYPAVGKDVSWFRGLGMSIPDYLGMAELVRDGLLLVHNVHLSREDAVALRGRGARFVLCPRSNANHRNGAPDVTHFVDTGTPFALGTDSLGSVDDLSMWEEMRAARSLYRGKLDDAGISGAVFRAATENGAAALGLPGGSLRPGRAADFIVAYGAGKEGNTSIGSLIERMGGSNILLTAVGGIPRYESAG